MACVSDRTQELINSRVDITLTARHRDDCPSSEIRLDSLLLLSESSLAPKDPARSTQCFETIQREESRLGQAELQGVEGLAEVGYLHSSSEYMKLTRSTENTAHGVLLAIELSAANQQSVENENTVCFIFAWWEPRKQFDAIPKFTYGIRTTIRR